MVCYTSTHIPLFSHVKKIPSCKRGHIKLDWIKIELPKLNMKYYKFWKIKSNLLYFNTNCVTR